MTNVASERFNKPMNSESKKIPAAVKSQNPVMTSICSPLTEAEVAEFAHWIDEALPALEHRFRHLIRPRKFNVLGR